MSYVRSAGYTLKDPEDDAAFQVAIGDLQRLALALFRGTPNAAYALTPEASANINSPAADDALLTTGYRLTGAYITGTGTHTFAVGSTKLVAILVGGGGGGGGGATAANVTAAGGGGGSGASGLLIGRIAAASLSYVIGGGGAGGAASALGDQSSAGSSSSMVYKGDTYTQTGGFGTNGGANMGGAGGTAQHYLTGTDAIMIGFNGGTGGTGAISVISVTGGVVGGVTSCPGAGGRGGIGGGGYGAGGAGGFLGNSGDPGLGGILLVYEA